jgi:hypothetical protein
MRSVAVVDAFIWPARVILCCACQILESDPVLDREQENAVSSEKLAATTKQSEVRIRVCMFVHRGILEDSDEYDCVEPLIEFDFVQAPVNDLHRGKVVRPLRRYLRSLGTSLDRDNVEPTFAQVPG